ncbi:L-lysine exporter family protein LysE/ArgO [Microbacterium sp. W4I4]|uniref:LysE/ArgO family amino acid transporter n=1 Tax=Microbacterium sp. W4I4 TaxID=3042295 RepID=UPI002783811C|nr:LysE/ArgO family amino acid transporter [Microbacterium sp. W4I4]MDQ0615613.1 L-lysine exporter family protein LysE/ArgO [Microbacterium sp. W4I4]
MLTFLAGLGLGLSLIVAIGAQNVFVLRQGLRREHVLPVVVICALSDAVLILVGVAGLGFLVERAPWLIVAARWAGALFLLGYGLLAARRAWRGEDALRVDDTTRTGAPVRNDASARATGTLTDVAPTTRLVPVIATTLALTWLNPHVYLDTVLMLGSVAATHGDARWLFAAGAVLASCLWFAGLGFGARHLGRWLRTPRAWRILDAGIAIVMIGLAVGLVLPVLTA